jgi:hypothetical protein
VRTLCFNFGPGLFGAIGLEGVGGIAPNGTSNGVLGGNFIVSGDIGYILATGFELDISDEGISSPIDIVSKLSKGKVRGAVGGGAQLSFGLCYTQNVLTAHHREIINLNKEHRDKVIPTNADNHQDITICLP